MVIFCALFVGYLGGGFAYEFYLGLCAINLAEGSGDAVSKEMIAQIYVTQAVSLKASSHASLQYASVGPEMFTTMF